MGYVFAPAARAAVPVGDSGNHYAVNRIFCVGRNYAAHVREMGFDPDREPPCYFTKSPAALTQSGATIPYPPGTSELHHEVELVVAIGKAGRGIQPDDAIAHVFGYACGLDMTRRDLQLASRANKGPWDLGKDFEHGAIVGKLAVALEIGHPVRGNIALTVNRELRQHSDLEYMIWSVPEIIADLSKYYRLEPGDLVFTGTPDGVGPVAPGDEIAGSIEGVGSVALTLQAVGE